MSVAHVSEREAEMSLVSRKRAVKPRKTSSTSSDGPSVVGSTSLASRSDPASTMSCSVAGIRSRTHEVNLAMAGPRI